MAFIVAVFAYSVWNILGSVPAMIYLHGGTASEPVRAEAASFTGAGKTSVEVRKGTETGEVIGYLRCTREGIAHGPNGGVLVYRYAGTAESDDSRPCRPALPRIFVIGADVG